MSSIINFERDLEFIKLGSPQVFFSNQQIIALNLNVTSDAVIYDNHTSMNHYSPNFAFALTSNYVRCLGTHIIGPDITGGSPYRIKGYASADEDYMVALMYGVGPSSPTPLAAGDAVIGSQPLLINRSHISFDKTVYIKSFNDLYPGQSYENRPITFYILVHRPNSVPATGASVYFALSVQRLSVKPPPYITANR